jgi:hypothetical protein
MDGLCVSYKDVVDEYDFLPRGGDKYIITLHIGAHDGEELERAQENGLILGDVSLAQKSSGSLFGKIYESTVLFQYSVYKL